MKEGWEVKKLGEVCSLLTDGDWIESKDQSMNGIRLIQTGNVGNGIYRDKSDHAKYISEETFDKLNCMEIFEGDILISRLPEPIGRACILPKIECRMITAVDCSIIRLKEIMLSKFLVYYTLSRPYNKGIEKYVTGAVRKRISRANLSKILVPIPPLPEQFRIVEELDQLSNIIEKKRQQLSELDNLAQSIFYNMFGDPVTNEKGWEIVTLGDVCDVTSFKRVLIEEVVDEGIPFIRGTELMALSKGENVKFTLFITDEHYEKVKAISGVPKIGDLLIPSINSEARIWILNTDKPMYYKDGRVLWVHVNEKLYASECLKYIMHELIKSSYTSVASGATFAELKLFVLRELKTIIPPLTLQQLFAQKIEAIEKEKELIKQSIKETEELFNSRMDYYFN